MTKLKTLKDISHPEKYKDMHETIGWNKCRLALRQEAIKEIKAIREAERSGSDFIIGEFCFYCCECVSSGHITDYIKWKNNLTEEDLK